MSSIDRIALRLRLNKAFTLVEVLIVITIIITLLGMATFISTGYVKTSRDSERESKSNIIASALEKYYEDNGEYPNCTVLTAAPSTVKSSTLTSLSNENILKAPKASAGVNSIKCDADIAPTDTDDAFVYTCTSETGACSEWQLKYRKESDNQIVTINSKYNSDSSAGALSAPNVTLVASLSGANSAATATATCSTGTPEYQIHSYRNSGTFPGTWTDSATQAISALNEGESATYQARARCVDPGFTSSAYKLSNVAAVNRAVTAPTGLVTTTTISGANAIGNVSGGSCAAGTTLVRQYQYLTNYYLYGGAWSGFIDIAGTSVSYPVNEGWQFNYHQIARCLNTTTGVGSDWTWGPVADAIRPISQIGVPNMVASANAARIRYSWGQGGWSCPGGTSIEYRLLLSRNDGYASDWWYMGTGTSFEWGDTYQGYRFYGTIQQRCTNSYTSGAWSGSTVAYDDRVVTEPGAPNGFSRDLAGNGGIAFSWNAPGCGPGVGGQYALDFVNGGGTGIKWIGRPKEDGWYYGGSGLSPSASSPDYGWIDAWGSSYGYLGDRNNPYSANPPRMNLDVGPTNGFDSGNQIGIAVQYRCLNSTTNWASGRGPVNGYYYTW